MRGLSIICGITKSTHSGSQKALRLIVTLCLLLYSTFSLSATSEKIFDNNQSRIFQIKLIEIESGSKAALGSGFVVGDSFTVATNYHVVSSAVFNREKYRIEFVRDDNSVGQLTLSDIDIVNDIALLKSDEDLGPPFELYSGEPNKGSQIYALGNPLDLGMTVIPGTYNGLTSHSYYERIHFSGSINSGMSGGPVVDENSHIVGINVATAGNQVSFLVPASKLLLLLANQHSEETETNLLSRSENQLNTSQQQLLNALLDKEWPEEKLGETNVIGEIDRIVSCWGNSSKNDDDDEQKVLVVSKGCSLQDSIYVSSRMSTGSIEYEFYWYEAPELAERRFYQYLENSMGGYPGNRAGKKDVTNFNCKESFTTVPSSKPEQNTMAKSFLCARRYKKFPSLYDIFYIRHAKRNDKAFVSHFTLAGFTQDSSHQFLNAFLEHVQWP